MARPSPAWPPWPASPAAATVAKMQAYKSGALPATLMHQIAKGYSDEQIQAIAAYFAAQKN
jgi:cytochrome subunit of sulfide dehydrogenase